MSKSKIYLFGVVLAASSALTLAVFENDSSRILPVAGCTIDEAVFETKSVVPRFNQSARVNAFDAVLDEYRQKCHAYYLVTQEFEARRLRMVNYQKKAEEVSCCRSLRQAILLPKYLYLARKYTQAYDSRGLALERLEQQRRAVKDQFEIIQMYSWEVQILMEQIEDSLKQKSGRPN